MHDLPFSYTEPSITTHFLFYPPFNRPHRDTMDLTTKLIIVGDGGCGKSSFVKKHKDGTFSATYICTNGHEPFVIKFRTNKGFTVTFIGTDLDGQSNHVGVSKIFNGQQCALVFYDVTSMQVSQQYSLIYCFREVDKLISYHLANLADLQEA